MKRLKQILGKLAGATDLTGQPGSQEGAGRKPGDATNRLREVLVRFNKPSAALRPNVSPGAKVTGNRPAVHSSPIFTNYRKG